MTGSAAPGLTDNQVWVLDSLRNNGSGGWLRPIDVGRPSSVVSRVLGELERKGLAESMRRPASTAKLYRVSAAGREVAL